MLFLKTIEHTFIKKINIFQIDSQAEVPDGKSVCPDHPRRKVPMNIFAIARFDFVKKLENLEIRAVDCSGRNFLLSISLDAE